MGETLAHRSEAYSMELDSTECICATLEHMDSLPSTMRAVVLNAVPAPPEALVVRERPVPTPEPGWVLIEVKAFGLNRSELKTRLGLADPDVTFPRVPGIEATGVVAACPGGELAVGQQVVAMMGGMGDSFERLRASGPHGRLR